MTAPAQPLDDKPDLVPQPHGGALYRRGVRGNRGNRLTEEVRKRALSIVATNMESLSAIAGGSMVKFFDDTDEETGETKLGLRLTSPSASERIAATKLAWDIAQSGKKVNLAEVKKRLTLQVAAIRELLPPEQADMVLAKLQEVWR